MAYAVCAVLAVLLCLFVCVSIVYRKQLYKYKHKENEYLEQLKKENEEELISIYNNKTKDLQYKYDTLESELKEKYNADAAFLNSEIESKRALIEQYKSDLNTNYRLEKEKIEEYKRQELEKVNTDISLIKEQLYQSAQREKEQLNTEISTIQTELNTYKDKRRTINEAIAKEREIKEKEKFFSVCLSGADLEDINTLQQLKPRLHSAASLDKIIFDCYVKRPLDEMVKRVTKGRAVSGIYKITEKETGLIYIGKSVDIGKRFQGHVKTAFGVGSLASSTFHTYMAERGVQNFTFEILEEVPKENLTEREKYYINFYESNKYGLNMREG